MSRKGASYDYEDDYDDSFYDNDGEDADDKPVLQPKKVRFKRVQRMKVGAPRAIKRAGTLTYRRSHLLPIPFKLLSVCRVKDQKRFWRVGPGYGGQGCRWKSCCQGTRSGSRCLRPGSLPL